LPIDAVADQVADRDAMLRGAAKYAVVDFAAADGEPPRAADEQPARADEAGRVPATPTARSTSAG